MTITLDGTTGITTPTTSTTGEFVTSVTGYKNRLINGAMVFDQRSAGAAVTYNGVEADGVSIGWTYSNGQFTNPSPITYITEVKSLTDMILADATELAKLKTALGIA